MNEIFIHIGLHKTATGTLQRQFFPACKNLNILTTLIPEVKAFVEEVTRRDPLYFDKVKANKIITSVIDTQKVNLLSNESLSGPPYAGAIEAGLDHRLPVLNNLSNVFPNAKVILVLRRQDALAKSFYRQYLKSGGTRSVHRFYGMDTNKGPALMSLDRFYFLKYVQAVISSFPAGVLILPFEEFVQSQTMFLKKLTEFIGVPMPNLELKSENATRLGPLGLEISRILNHLFRNLLNPAGIIPGFKPKRAEANYRNYRVSPLEIVHDKWFMHKKCAKGEIDRIASKIFYMVEDDNKNIDKIFNLNLRYYGYYK